jgi:hypothetical protein
LKITLLTGKIFDLEKEFDFPLRIVSGRNSRRLTLRIDSRTHQVVLSLPKICSVKTAREFVVAHQDWIERRLTELPSVSDFCSGDVISLFGQTIRLCGCPDSLRAVREEDGVLYVGGDPAFFHRRVKDYICRKAKKEFEERSRRLAEKLGCTLKRVTIKDTKSRWGSCSILNNINYNWRIALAPLFVIDYLMAHEVAHLKHRDHSAAFWDCVKALYSDAALGRCWLKNNGKELYRYR